MGKHLSIEKVELVASLMSNSTATALEREKKDLMKSSFSTITKRSAADVLTCKSVSAS